MNLIISNISKEPIYEQIKNQLKKQILLGDIREGDLLPSIRSLAKELGVSVITTKRAYDDLEVEGYIATMQGKGSYVLGRNTERLREQKLCEIEELLQTAIDRAESIGVAREQLIEMLDLLYEK
ncbi:MAG: GntR family transcriptional regulator [Filifactor alocis]|nr:GntR family transcriptional regulator [Filifactor alocis]